MLAQSTSAVTQARPVARSSIDWITPALAGIFVLSGASGLVYQIAWVRLLGLTFGVTIYAISIVVAAFMGGLALGSFVGGRLADRVTRPILWYAGIELAVAAIGLASPTILAWVQAAYVALYPRDATEAALGVIALRFVLAAVVLLVPTTLMGATLPLMVRGSLTISQTIGPRISLLYAANTTGAILGTLSAGFFLIGGVGISGTIVAAAVLNTLAGFAAFLLASGARPIAAGARDETGMHAARVSDEAAPPRVRALVIGTFAVQGFVSLAYEIVWTRVLAVMLDGSTYAFSIILATVLFGITVGSALVGPLMSRKLPWLGVYAVLQTGVAVLGILGIIAFARVYGITQRLEALPFLARLLDSHYAWIAVVAIIAVLPPMILLGMSFPVAARIVVSGSENTGRDLGVLYAGNTTGAILGAWLAGFLLIPTFGTQVSIELLAIVNTALAVALGIASGQRRPILVASTIVLVLGATVLAQRLAPDMYRHIVASRFGNDVLWVGEGQETSVAVTQNRVTGVRTIFINGQPQASSDGGMVWFHRLLGHLPMIVHNDPRDVLIVGIGGGATAGALAQHNPDRLDIVELSHTVVEGARLFSDVNHNVLEFPNLRLKIDDGRNHLLLTDRKYDIITADAILPRNAGASVLYSYEYYELARKALKPGGLMAQWLEDRGDNPDNDTQRKLMTRTFLKAFPHASMWAFGALLIGSNEPIDTSQANIIAKWDRRRLGDLMAGSGFESPEAVHSLFIMGDADLRKWAGEGPIMTDNHPYVEYFLSLPGRTGGLRDLLH